MPAENNPAMPDAPPAVLYRVLILGRLFSQRTVNTLWYFSDVPPATPAILKQAAANVWATLSVSWCTAVSVDWSLSGVLIRNMSDYFSVAQLADAASLVALGLQTQGVQGDSCPPQDAVVCKRTTAQIGKRSRGRVYVSGVAEADHIGGQLIAAGQLRFNALALAIATNSPAAGGAPMLEAYHGYAKHTPPNNVVAQGLPIVTCTADSIIRSQRRRQIGVGV